MSIDWNGLTRHTDHRPWPMPARPWIMTMSWVDLLFAHWRVPRDVLGSLIPEPLEVDTHDGDAWISVVPFRMEHVGPRGLPLPERLADFPELNLRTYVTHGGRAGVWFFSLDAASLPAVVGARAAFHLPYFHADMEVKQVGPWTEYVSRRKRDGATFRGRYRSTDAVAAPPGSLEHWLTERYCLYCADGLGRVHRGEIHHQRWPLLGAEAEIEENTVACHLAGAGLTLDGPPASVQISRRIDVVAWSLDPV